MNYSNASELRSKFWRKVDVGGANTCWTWIGAKANYYYGFYSSVEVKKLAHRLALSLFDGHEHSDKLVRHLCDNSICCNPNHLAWGTIQENNLDCKERRLGLKKGALHPRVRAPQAPIQVAVECLLNHGKER